MMCVSLDCRTLPVLGLEIVHNGVAEGVHAAHRFPKALPDRRLPLHLRRRKVGVDNDCVLGKRVHQRLQILGLKSDKGVYYEIM
jgi:hypothetical protein